MDKLEQVTELVGNLGLKPSDVVKYWQKRGLLSTQKNKKNSSAISKNSPVSSDIRNRVKKVVAEKIGIDIDQIADNFVLREDLHIDSLDEVEVIIKLEKEFKIEISENEALKVKTVGDIIQLVANHV